MALNIFDVPVKTTISHTLQSKSIMVVGKSKAGKSTICSQAPRPVFLMTENGGEFLTGFTPIPIASWGDFKMAVNQLTLGTKGRETFDTVVIDTYTNLILLLDKYVGTKLSTEKSSMDFGSDADYGKGSKSMRNELGTQLQKLANAGYILMNIVHAEDKVDFQTQKPYIGTSLSNSLYGVAEKFVDQIIYLKRSEKPDKDGNFEYRTYFNAKGGFSGTGGRLSPKEDFVPTSFANIEAALLRAMEDTAGNIGAKLTGDTGPSVTIEEKEYDFDALMKEFKALTAAIVGKYGEGVANKIKAVIEKELGAGKQVSRLTPAQAELLATILFNLKQEFAETEMEAENTEKEGEDE